MAADEDADSVSIAVGFSTAGIGCRAAADGAVFFAAIVFAGFLAALRAAGLVPAAFFFFGAALARFATEPALFDAACFFAAVLRTGRMRFAAILRPYRLVFAAALRAPDRLVLAAALRAPGRLVLAETFRALERVVLAAPRGADLRLAALVAERLAVLRIDRFTAFLAADLFFAAMVASAYEGTPRYP